MDVYSGTEMELRERLYRQSLDAANEEALRQHPRFTKPLRATEIGLLTLDRYREGGLSASLVKRSRIEMPPRKGAETCSTDGYDRDACERDGISNLQSRAYKYIRGQRQCLLLGHTHPQCLFERARALDDGITSLYKISKTTLICLRHAARWATALRVQELCMKPDDARDGHPLNDMTKLACDLKGNLSDSPGLSRNKAVAESLGGECVFADVDLDEGNEVARNRKILIDLRNNAAFRDELKERNGLPANSDKKISLPMTYEEIEALPGPALSGKLEEVCNLDEIYPEDLENHSCPMMRGSEATLGQ